MGIGHVRYPTAGSLPGPGTALLCQLSLRHRLAHNGNLTNAEELNRDIFLDDLRHINTDSDSEVLLNVFAHELHAQQTRLRRPISSMPWRACIGVAVAPMPPWC